MADNYDDLIQQAYANYGRTGIGSDPNQIDPEGYNYWQQQLTSGAINPQDFGSVFNQAAQGALPALPTPPIPDTFNPKPVIDYYPPRPSYPDLAADPNNPPIDYGYGYEPWLPGGGGKPMPGFEGDRNPLPEVDSYATSPGFPDPYAPVVSKPVVGQAGTGTQLPDYLMYADRGPRDQAFEPTGGPLSAMGAMQTRTVAATPTVDDLIKQAYASIGRTNIDPEGLAYWRGQLTGTNALTPQQFGQKFNQAVSGVLADPSSQNAQIASDVTNYLYSNPNANITMPKVSSSEVMEAFRAIPGANPNFTRADVDYYQKAGIGQLIKDVRAINASNPRLAAEIAAKRAALGLPNQNVVGNTVRPDLPIVINRPRPIR